MSLATRCAACGTIFRVVQDQLKVSEGWVRCGRCQEVFNALEGLFDLERDAPPRRNPKPRPAATPQFGEFVSSRFGTEDSLAATREDDAIESRFLSRFALRREADPPPSGPPDFADARFPSELPADAADDPTPPASADSSQPAAPHDGDAPAAGAVHAAGDAADDAPLTPGFVRQAEAAARWRRPRVRASLAVAALLLAGVLSVQVAVQFRDLFAARWPAARPALDSLCMVLGCDIGPLRRLASVSVESSSLTQIEGSEAYRLSLTLANRGTLDVALPAVDLRLTDARGALLARRALLPSDLRVVPGGTAPRPVLAAGTETQLQALLAARGLRTSGYTVELFHP